MTVIIDLLKRNTSDILIILPDRSLLSWGLIGLKYAVMFILRIFIASYKRFDLHVIVFKISTSIYLTIVIQMRDR